MKTTIDNLNPSHLDSGRAKEATPLSGVSGLRGSAGLALMTVLAACRAEDLVNYGSLSDGSGGGQPCLTLPFEAGQEWQLTQGYNGGSHVDYGSRYFDDSHALDFARAGVNNEDGTTTYGCEETYGQNVYPLADAVVSYVYFESSTKEDYGYWYGNGIRLDHGNGYESQYSHLSEVAVSEGDSVTVNDVLGKVGATGNVKSTNPCPDPEKVGTHLHLNLYKLDDENWPEGIPPEPLSGYSMSALSWYERSGDGSGETCDESSSESEWTNDEDQEDDGNGDLKITFADVSPHSGSEAETAFIWVAIVDSPYDKPETTLWIYNPDDRHSYEFEMETESVGSPWVFTYRKTLNDNLDYTYWVLASGEDHNGEHTNDASDETQIDVEERSYDEPEGYDQTHTSHGEAGVTEFDWSSHWESDDRPAVELKIVSAQDNQIYSFDMDVSEDGGLWEATYEKTLRDAAIYTFWMEADNGESTNTTSVKSIEVTD